MAETRSQSTRNPKTLRSRRYCVCFRRNPSNARTTSPRPRQVHHFTTQKKKTTSSTHTACLQVCFVSAKSVENNLYINSCSHRRCGSTVPTTSTSHGWRTISVDTNRTNSNTTEPRCTSMHRRIAQRSGRRSHTPRVRLTDHGVGQHRPKL